MEKAGDGDGEGDGTLCYSSDATPLPVLAAATVAAFSLVLQPSLPPSSAPTLCLASGSVISLLCSFNFYCG